MAGTLLLSPLTYMRKNCYSRLVGIGFQAQDTFLSDVADVVSADDPVAITVDGHRIREPPGPKGLPFVGNYLEVYPDHLGNHQRLFDQYGPIIKTNNMGRVVYQTNDPNIAAIVFAESDFFSKLINEAHPLYALKTPAAGVFLGDTNTPEWKVAHKFLPPALGPKAVRHYAPTMQGTVEDAYKVFDALDEQGEAWNVYQYMLKLGSQAVGKLTLGMDFQHFSSPDAPLHEMVHLIAETLTLNKKVTSKGNWYGKLPFGDPQRLRDMRARVEEMINESISAAKKDGSHDLPLQDAALEAANMVGKYYLSFRFLMSLFADIRRLLGQIMQSEPRITRAKNYQSRVSFGLWWLQLVLGSLQPAPCFPGLYTASSPTPTCRIDCFKS